MTEEAVEFAAGHIKGVLLLFRAVVDQWAAVGMNRLAKKSLRSNLSQRRRVVQVADNFSTQCPEIVYVPANGFRRKTGCGQMLDEWPEASNQFFPWRQVFFQSHPRAHILDRFHIVAQMNKALDDIRAAESRQMAQDGYQPLLNKTRWCVLKRKENLTAQQKFRLRDLLRYNLQTVRAYLLKEDFQQFWE